MLLKFVSIQKRIFTAEITNQAIPAHIQLCTFCSACMWSVKIMHVKVIFKVSALIYSTFLKVHYWIHTGIFGSFVILNGEKKNKKILLISLLPFKKLGVFAIFSFF